MLPEDWLGEPVLLSLFVIEVNCERERQKTILTAEISAASLTLSVAKKLRNEIGNCEGSFIKVELVE